MKLVQAIRPLIPDFVVKVVRLSKDFRNPGGLMAYSRSRRRCRNDSYVPWLCQIMGGWLHPNSGNIVALDHAIANLPAETAVLEIGSFLGLSTNVIGHLLRKHNKTANFFSSDPWEFEGTEDLIGGVFDAASSNYRDYVKTVFMQNCRTFAGSNCPYAFEVRSDQFFEKWSSRDVHTDLWGRQILMGGPLGLAYIDGEHSYKQCLQDFLNVDRVLAVGGFILFDDSADNSAHTGCKEVVQELRKDPRYRLVFRQPNYLFKKVQG